MPFEQQQQMFYFILQILIAFANAGKAEQWWTSDFNVDVDVDG